MNIQLLKASLDDLPIVQNLARFYAYEMFRYCGFSKGWSMPENGLYECIDLSCYWTKTDRYPFVIKVDGELSGFVLINKVGSSSNVDWNMGEFFITAKYQGKGIGSYVAELIFQQFPGTWEVMRIPENKPAMIFWEKVIDRFTQGKFSKCEKTILEPSPHPMSVLTFSSP